MRYINSGFPGVVNHGKRLRRPAPLVNTNRLVMIDMRGNICLRRNTYRFIHGVKQASGFIAHVRDIYATVLRGNLRQLYDFFGFCIIGGDVQ